MPAGDIERRRPARLVNPAARSDDNSARGNYDGTRGDDGGRDDDGTRDAACSVHTDGTVDHSACFLWSERNDASGH
jgi:hypothetical protein